MDLEIIENDELHDVHDNLQEFNAKIKVVGVGGGGGNAVNWMIKSGLSGVEFYAINTDVQVLNSSLADHRIVIGKELTKGLGAGGDPTVGEKAALEDEKRLQKLFAGTDMVFIAAGMGGGTGTGSAPVIAKIAQEAGALTVGVVTTPFDFERAKKRELAKNGVEKLYEVVDTLITIPNENLTKLGNKKMPVGHAFALADEVLYKAVKGITDTINIPGYINIDFADVRAVMKDQGNALMGIGQGKGENRAVDAATNAINNPILDDIKIEGATGILVNVIANSELALSEFEEIVHIVTASCDNSANVISGLGIDESLDDEVLVVIIATGFDSNNEKAEIQNTIDENSDHIKLDEWNGIGLNLTSSDDSSYVNLKGDDFANDFTIPPFLRKSGSRVDD